MVGFVLSNAAIVLPILALPTVSATSANAAGACLSSHPNYFAGWGYYNRPPTSWRETPVGVSAFVRARPGALMQWHDGIARLVHHSLGDVV